MKLVLLTVLLLFAGVVFSQTDLNAQEDDLEMLATKLNADDAYVEMAEEIDGFGFDEIQNEDNDDTGIAQSVSWMVLPS